MFLFCVSFLASCKAQETEFNKEYKDKTIEIVNQLLTDYYVFPEVAIETKRHLNALNRNGHFNKYQELDSFIDELSNNIYKITKDRHLSVTRRSVSDRNNIEKDPLTRWINERMEEREFFRQYNANFKEVKKLKGNIGYLDLRGFYGLDYGRETADQVMSLLAKSDAIIIDLRNNSGGRGSMSDYLVSYFFKEPVITSKTVKRTGDNTFEEKIYKSSKIVGGRRMPDVPLYILTSNKTFSAAEGFTYALKVYNRATIIGQKTKGGANPGDLISINDELQIFVSDVAVTHPLTDDSWEGVGIQPDIDITSEQALDTALVIARSAAKKFKTNHDKRARTLLRNFDDTVNNFDKEKNENSILDAYLLCKKNDLIFEEWEINTLGYQMYEEDKLETAEAILKANTIIYPFSANTFNNYGEILFKNGKTEEALSSYKQAVFVAIETDHQDLERFKKNLENLVR